MGTPAPVLAQGSLTPSGPPGPTMRSLDQLEPRVPVNETTAPGDAEWAHIIEASGSYYLTGSLDVGKLHGILIRAPAVTLDLNGFEIRHVALAVGDGIRINLEANRCTVKNGSVTGFQNGVHVYQPDDELPENTARAGNFSDILVSDCSGDGIVGGDAWTISGCVARDNGRHGISGWEGVVVTECVSRGNSGHGFFLRQGGVVRACNASSNSQSGISAGRNSRVEGCVARGNGEHGVSAGRSSVVTGCVATANAGSGIAADGGSIVSDCLASDNTGPAGIELFGTCMARDNTCAGNVAGILATGFACRIEGNHVSENATGVSVNLSGNLIVGNAAAANTEADFSIAAGNRHGPIVDIRIQNTEAVIGNASLDKTTTTHPRANFSF